MEYDITIGLEVHAELKTASKLFCGCANAFGGEPNTNCCPICGGFPGALPTLNKRAVELTVMAGHTIGSRINNQVFFERKHYFYPDLSTAYQISQLEKPICVGGGIVLSSGKSIRINRIHLEEDAGKIIHYDTFSVTDGNRGGVPLIELVTEPDVSSADEALEFLEELRRRYVFSGVAECKMEEGGMRCDVNLSVKQKGQTQLGVRTEMKNLNSFKAVRRAIEFEAARQIEVLNNGGKLHQQTRRWDDEAGRNYSMRSKEEATDYRYMPDPDLVAVNIPQEMVERLRAQMPTPAHELRKKFLGEYKLSEYETDILVSDPENASLFERGLKLGAECEPKKFCAWFLNDLLSLKKSAGDEVFASNFELYVKVVAAVESQKINRSIGTMLLKSADLNAAQIEAAIKDAAAGGVGDAEIEKIISGLIAAKESLVADYKADPSRVSPFVIGQVMKQTAGKAKAPDVIRILANIMK